MNLIGRIQYSDGMMQFSQWMIPYGRRLISWCSIVLQKIKDDKEWMNMSYDETVMKDLLWIIPQKGKVEWIGIRAKKKEELSVVESVKVEKGTGLVGDHFKRSSSGIRQVTLI